MRKVTLDELKSIAVNSKAGLWAKAKSVDKDVVLYLHWTAGRYGQFFEDYHLNIDADGSIFISTSDLSETKAHTWHRNTGAIGISLACCYNATSRDLGEYPPTDLQIEAMAQTITILCTSLDLTIDKTHVMTHAEAADLDGYGPSYDCQRWDLAILKNGDKWMSGGDILRGKAIFYRNTGVC